ncbi:hypothetical protein P43SY_007417 [Pythium insidiosum]|uniref:Uncharacterized protein n=1 Tax=Pythium insidiosum TaxID=114742 RepID=A0AAD5LUM7_PYTIN|nr:hypothetical protein P43SY_007417 [Pythium insidiosum]
MEGPHSNRIKHIIDLVDLIPFHADSQRNILDEKITHVLKSKAANEKLREEEEAEAKKKAHERDCLACLHLHGDLKMNYLEERNPAVIWKSLRLRFDTARKQTLLPLVSDEWSKLCFYNYKNVTEFASVLYSLK